MLPSSDRTVWLSRYVVPHEPALRAWLRRWRGHDLEIDDIVQETYAILAEKASVDHIRDPRAYVFQTARSIILMYVRRAQVVSIQAVEDIERLSVPDDCPGPEEQLVDRDNQRRLTAFIARLPELARRAFTLRIVDGLSQRQIGERLGISENAAQKHIAKSLRHLMRMFEEGGNEAPDASRQERTRASE